MVARGRADRTPLERAAVHLCRPARPPVTVVLTAGQGRAAGGYGKYPARRNWRGGTIYERFLPRPVRHAVARAVVPRLQGLIGRTAPDWSLRGTPPALMLRTFRVDRPGGPTPAPSPTAGNPGDAAQATLAGRVLRADERQGKFPIAPLADIKTYLV